MDYYEVLTLLASSDLIKGHLFIGVDIYGYTYVYIDSLDALKNKSIYIDLTGRGVSLDDACFEYIKILLNTHYVLRSKKHHGYITHKIRTFVKVFAKVPFGYLPDKGVDYM